MIQISEMLFVCGGLCIFKPADSLEEVIECKKIDLKRTEL
jgi:hypothetical protein